MESRFFCEEHGEELEVENVTSRGGDVYIFVAPCKQCTSRIEKDAPMILTDMPRPWRSEGCYVEVCEFSKYGERR